MFLFIAAFVSSAFAAQVPAALHCVSNNPSQTMEEVRLDLVRTDRGAYDALFSRTFIDSSNKAPTPVAVAKNMTCDVSPTDAFLVMCQKSPLVDNERSNSYLAIERVSRSWIDMYSKPHAETRLEFQIFSPVTMSMTANSYVTTGGTLKVSFAPEQCQWER